MIVDAREVEGDLRADICIVGAGAAGIAVALQFLEGRQDVLLMEAGGEDDEPETQALYGGEVADERLHAPPVNYRRRAFGGSTAIWGGRCMPFDPIDFAQRPWMPGPGWPIGIEEVMPFYPAANAICEAGDFAYTAQEAFPGGMRPLLKGFAGRHFSDDTLERFSCPTDFGRRYRARIAQSRRLRLVLHANVTELRTGVNGSFVDSLAVQTLTGRAFSVRARQVVLAMGGLEVPRLLLASRDRHARGIGNAHDQVGRNYMCHIAGSLGEVHAVGNAKDHWHSYQIADDGVYCRRRFALRAQAQAQLGVGNFVTRLHHPRIPDPAHRTGSLSALMLAKPLISYEYSKRLHGEGALALSAWVGHVRNVVLDPVDTAGFLLHFLARRTLAARKFPTVIVRPKSGVYTLDFHSEQEANPESRVSLVAARDALGMQRIRVDWRYTGGDIRTVRVAAEALAEDMAESGCARLRFDPESVEECALQDGAYGGHHIGTARMARSASQGVVDAECRVHGMRNLFVAGSAVFPTSGQANPTLTIVALALRLAEKLAKEPVVF